ncbi:MAG: VWA domain-containing protein [Planctomycetaceae bacterium]|nr:VWA domain-containing protein [Planctomycetaceae bacterium]
MPHTAEISRATPTCFLFLIDQSGSMADPIASAEPSSGRSKAQFVADALNSLLQGLVLRCAREEGIRGYFDVGVIGYGNSVGPALAGALAGRELVSITDLGNYPARLEERTRKVEDGVGGLIDQKIKKPIWIDPVANGGTPMCEAFRQAISLLKAWIGSHPQSFPPSVIHITDGESSDGDPLGLMREVTSLATSDGNCLLYNFHISSNAAAKEIVFADSLAGLPDQYATLLFNGASPLIPGVRNEVQRQGMAVSEGARGFLMNAQTTTIIQAMDIGTKPSALR